MEGSDLVRAGYMAYTLKQVSIQEVLANDFAAMWLAGLQDAKLPAPFTWPQQFLSVVPSSKEIQHRKHQTNLASAL